MEMMISTNEMKTILLVDHVPVMRDTIERHLTNLGYTVLAASSGHEAIDRAHHHNGIIHLLITDMLLPDMTGRLLAQRLIETRPTMTVLFMSSFTPETLREQGMRLPESAFLHKPFTRETLIRHVSLLAGC